MSKLKFRFSQVEMHKYFYQKCISYVDIDREIFAITGEAFIIIRDTQEKKGFSDISNISLFQILVFICLSF